jgi:hypothetical protein
VNTNVSVRMADGEATPLQQYWARAKGDLPLEAMVTSGIKPAPNLYRALYTCREQRSDQNGGR